LGSAHLGAFVALAYLGQIVAMFTGALADSVIGGLARLADARDAKGFTRLLGLLVSFGAFVSTVSALGAWLFGEQIVRLLLGPDYVNQPVLILLMAGAGLITLQRCLGRGLQAAHRYQWVLVVDTVTLVATVAAGAFMIPAYGLVGASLTLGMGFGVGVLVAAAMLLRVVRSMSDEPRPTDRATAP
jgi:O-antigen/teichoic acid export membrane protein